MDYDSFIFKYNTVVTGYEKHLENKKLLNNDLVGLLAEKTLDLIFEYGVINKVNIEKCDDMKIKYFFSYALYQYYYENNGIKNNKFMLIGLEMLSKSWINDNPTIIEKTKVFLSTDNDFKKYYGLFGIYKIVKAIYYEKNECEKLVKNKPDKEVKDNIVNNISITYNVGEKSKLKISGNDINNKPLEKNNFFLNIIEFILGLFRK